MIMCFSKAHARKDYRKPLEMFDEEVVFKFKLFKVFGYLVQSPGIFVIIELKIRLIAISKYC